ncbi:MAG TPA: M48 family metallopeptidase [Leptospiraceae bacterium]|nr:M48 family metallopeptidase [Leptospiraceae bacterium]HMW04497.1 M48 family metallopeptidase [Leptospiraceae bacterium]HMX31155.1 M48 family metallopeptidase [Leptospiraceae bacterium]HMY30683.1 M48 family metallopeptidase [Leptospiraceae bacterium]HMZ63248.1 M48 family metallopeptidase [Leptospiraceae bacterium]
MKNLKLITLYTILLFGITCATSPTGRSRILLVKDAEMNQAGTDAFQEIKSKTPIETGARQNAYVKCIANAILGVINDDTGVQSWEVVVFRDETPNAFALPGGKIGVHTGILPVAKTSGQLAAVMGHEVAHVLARHGAERVSDSQIVNKGMGAVGAASGNNAAVMGAIGAGAKFGVMLPFSRKHESEADILGLEYMAKAGFDPKESIDLWKNMAAMGGSKPMEIMSTHPSDETRMKQLNEKIPDADKLYKEALEKGKRPNCSL